MTTAHTHPVIFGRKLAGCQRCSELTAGAPPVAWRNYGREADAQRVRAIRSHDCGRARCGPVCTFGQH